MRPLLVKMLLVRILTLTLHESPDFFISCELYLYIPQEAYCIWVVIKDNEYDADEDVNFCKIWTSQLYGIAK